MAETVRIGLMGCGLVSLGVHLVNLPRLRGADIAGAWDADPRRLRRVFELAPDVPHFESREALLAGPIDAVIIATPYEQHAESAIAALEAGKHVYLEKPFGMTAEEAALMAAASEASGRISMVGFNYRYNPLVEKLEAEIRSGRIGKLVSLRTVFASSPHEGVDWDITRHGDHGALFDLAPHHLDLARVLTGSEAAAVSAEVRSWRTKKDTAHVQLSMADGTLVQCCLQLNSVEEHRFEAYGEMGKLSIDLIRSLALEFTPLKATRLGPMKQRIDQLFQPVTHWPYLLTKLRHPWHEPSFLPAITAFLNAVRSGQAVAPDFKDGLACQLLLEAALTSALTGRRTEVAR